MVKIKFLAISVIFIDEPEARVDVLIVGDDLKRSIENVLRTIESEIGHDSPTVPFETSEFLYRVSVYDKFVRDILDFRHDRVIDRLGVGRNHFAKPRPRQGRGRAWQASYPPPVIENRGVV